MNTGVKREVIDSLGGLQDTIKPLEQSLKQHEMRPFEVEPNYREDLLRSRGKLSRKVQRDASPEFDETKSEYLKKMLTNQNGVLKNSTIISASPYRAVIRKKPNVDENGDSSDENGEEEDQFARVNEVSDFSGRDVYMSGKLPETNERGELLTAPPAERKNNLMSNPEDLNDGFLTGIRESVGRELNTSKMSESVNDESQLMRNQRNDFINQFNEKRGEIGENQGDGPIN